MGARAGSDRCTQYAVSSPIKGDREDEDEEDAESDADVGVPGR